MRSLLLLVFCPLTALDGAAAQPPKPLIDIEIAGPAALRQSFLATNVGGLIGSQETKETWAKWMLEVAKIWYRSEGAHDQDTFGIFRGLLAEYRGRMRLRAFALPDAGVEGIAGLLEFKPDGRTDLAKIARGARQLLTNLAPKAVGKLEIGDRTIGFLRVGPGHMTLPKMEGDTLVMILGTATERAVPFLTKVRKDTDTVGAETQTNERIPPFRAKVNLAQLIALTEGVGRPVWFPRFVSDFLGYPSMQALEIQAKPQGPHIQLDVSLAVKKFGALYDILLPPTTTPPQLGKAPHARYWTKLPVSYAKALEALGPYFSEDDSFAEFLESLKPGLTVLGDFHAGCLILEAKHPKALIKAIEHALRREETVRERYRDIEIRSFQATSQTVAHRAHHGGRLYVGLGSKGRRLLEAALDAELDAKKTTEATAAKASLQLRFQPAHCNGAGVLSLESATNALIPFIIEDSYSWIRHRLDRVVSLPADAPGLIERGSKKILPLLKKHRLDDVRWFTARNKNRLSFRFLW